MAMPTSVQSIFDIALQRRSGTIPPETNAFRLIDDLGDQLPGIELETFADRWLLSTRNRTIPENLHQWLLKKPHSIYWKKLDDHQKESPTHFSGPLQEQPFLALENGLSFEISFQSGYSQGIFLDQRQNRSELRKRLSPGQTLLNTFAYTGAFSVCAAAAGATTTTLDLAQPYLDWAKRNFSANRFDPSQHYFCKGDTFHWLERFARQGRRFHGIVLDPPTFSRDAKGKVFRVEKDYGRLAELALQCLEPGGFILACTNFRQLTPQAFESMIRRSAPRPVRCTHRPMPPDFTAPPYLKSIWIDT